MDTRTTPLLRMFAAQSGVLVGDDGDEAEGHAEALRRASIPESNFIFNAASAFLYLVTMYAVLPTAGLYTESLGSSKAMSGVLMGGVPLASLFSAIYFSNMSSSGFKRPLVIATALCLFGNLMYSLAATFNSLALAGAGRLMIGLGGARGINRRYVADCAPFPQLVHRSSEFVTASALGMSLGPAMAGIINRLPATVFVGLYFDERTYASWAMVLLWAAFLAALIQYFVEPTPPPPVLSPPQLSPSYSLESGHTPLLAAEDGRRPHYGSVPAADRARLRNRSLPLRDLLSNKVVLFGLFVYFSTKLVCELTVSSSALVLPYFFDWRETSVSAFVATIGLLMFPANMAVSYVSQRLEENKQLIYTLIVVHFGCLLGVPLLGFMPLPQYVLACVVIFVSTNVGEAVLMAVLARAMPPSLARGTWNSGLLTTECGMSGRFVGDIATTVCASGVNGMPWILWRAYVPSTILAGACLGGAFYYETLIAANVCIDDIEDSDEVVVGDGKSSISSECSSPSFYSEFETMDKAQLK
jgi:MFS family permease